MKVFSYCGDFLDEYGVLYTPGKGGALANMDIDCDGGVADDGRCGNSADTQGVTAFQSTVVEYNSGIDDLSAFVHPYVVFGNQGDKYVSFDPTEYGVEPLSVMAIVCNNKVVSSNDSRGISWIS